ncbi:hypothetical protein FHS16_005632 [Paenibacillus endophyticus]|uniref:Pullulanase n=1 Tax=Paenibacillus endophyticus TaxID=1294268 RepID=A0A7W5CEQ5_9BACL|nr:DUF6509 family protein [Paenibacillus endophyticus]MBB3155524.1 hypothetical protein [Paenibacillus endophyticus]
MFTITEYSSELVKDPYGILTGKRYEMVLDLEVEEDDELYQEEGISLRVIFVVEEAGSRVAKYEFLTRATNAYLDFELEEDEEQTVLAFCAEHYDKAE